MCRERGQVRQARALQVSLERVYVRYLDSVRREQTQLRSARITCREGGLDILVGFASFP